MRYFCTRFPRDGKPRNWHSDRNGYRTPASFSSSVLIPTKDNAVEKKFEKKTSETFGSYLVKSLPLHPLLRKSNLRIDILTEPVLRTFSSSFISLSQRETTRKRKKKKNFRKYLEDMLKSSYLCIRFLKRKSDSKRSDLWIIYINNTSSTRARLLHLNEVILGIKKEPSSNLYI